MLKSGAAVSDGGIPEIYSKKLETANVGLTQKLGDHCKLTLGAQNVLNPLVEDVYRLPAIKDASGKVTPGEDIPRKEYREGRRYSVALSVSW